MTSKRPPTDDEPSSRDDPARTDPATLPDCLCAADGVLTLLGQKYAIPLVCAIGAMEPVRFSSLEGALAAASTSTLSTRLDELVDAGIVERTQFDEIPPRVEYELSDEGTELSERIAPLVEWARTRP